MDAQQRLLLEGSWEALAHSLPRPRTGVFAYTSTLAYMYVMYDCGCYADLLRGTGKGSLARMALILLGCGSRGTMVWILVPSSL